VIFAQCFVFVSSKKALISQKRHLPKVIEIAAADSTTFAGCQVLRGVKREGADVNSSCGNLIRNCPQRLRTVLDDTELVSKRKITNFGQIARKSVQMDRHDCFSFAAHSFANRRQIKIEVISAYVHVTERRTTSKNGIPRCTECETGRDHLVTRT